MGQYLIVIAIIYLIIGLLNYMQVANRVDKVFEGLMTLDYKGVLVCVFAWPWSYFYYKGMEDDIEG